MTTDIKVVIECVEVNDTAGITKIQAKINNWITKGELKKYDMHTTSTHVVFNICKSK